MTETLMLFAGIAWLMALFYSALDYGECRSTRAARRFLLAIPFGWAFPIWYGPRAARAVYRFIRDAAADARE